MRKLIVGSIMLSVLLFSAGISNSCSKVDDIIDITIPVPFAINNNLSTNEILRSLLNHNSIYLILLVYFISLITASPVRVLIV